MKDKKSWGNFSSLKDRLEKHSNETQFTIFESWNLKNYERHYLENWKNVNVYYILDNSIMLILIS